MGTVDISREFGRYSFLDKPRYRIPLGWNRDENEILDLIYKVKRFRIKSEKRNRGRRVLSDSDYKTINKKLSSLKKEYRSRGGYIELSFKSKDIEFIDGSFRHLNKVNTLDLTGNFLEDLPENFHKLSELEELFLGENKLHALPKSFGRLKNIVSLELDHNRLTTLPESFTNLENLKYLKLESNGLTSLPKNIDNLISLETLCIDGNNFKNLPYVLLNMIDNGLKVKDMKLKSIEKLINKSDVEVYMPNAKADNKKLSNRVPYDTVPVNSYVSSSDLEEKKVVEVKQDYSDWLSNNRILSVKNIGKSIHTNATLEDIARVIKEISPTEDSLNFLVRYFNDLTKNFGEHKHGAKYHGLIDIEGAMEDHTYLSKQSGLTMYSTFQSAVQILQKQGRLRNILKRISGFF